MVELPDKKDTVDIRFVSGLFRTSESIKYIWK